LHVSCSAPKVERPKMPRVISYNPAWLSNTAPAARVFHKDNNQNVKQELEAQSGHGEFSQIRTIAHRGTEVFAAVGKTIRWTDFAIVKDDWENKNLSQAVSKASINNDDEFSEIKHKVGFENYL
jgi:hypothetical protein